MWKCFENFVLFFLLADEYLMNAYEKNSGMKAPIMPAVEERIADIMNVFFRPDIDDYDDDSDGEVYGDDDVILMGCDDGMMMASPILSASQPQPKLPTIRPTM